MDEQDQAELDATQAAFDRLIKEGCALTGDDLLNLATEQAGYDVGNTRVERCDACGSLYHADYGGEYVDRFDHHDLMKELRIRGMAKLYYMHFCDFICLSGKAREHYKSH